MSTGLRRRGGGGESSSAGSDDAEAVSPTQGKGRGLDHGPRDADDRREDDDDDDRKSNNKLTLMEEVVLLGLKDKQVRLVRASLPRRACGTRRAVPKRSQEPSKKGSGLVAKEGSDSSLLPTKTACESSRLRTTAVGLSHSKVRAPALA
jgi:hypothetical protein